MGPHGSPNPSSLPGVGLGLDSVLGGYTGPPFLPAAFLARVLWQRSLRISGSRGSDNHRIQEFPSSSPTKHGSPDAPKLIYIYTHTHIYI